MIQELSWIIEWYFKQNNENWKNGRGIKISTIDNPGLCLWVYLNDTILNDKKFDQLIIETTENNWIHCYVRDNIFQGVGGIFNFPELVSIFCSWAELPKKNKNFYLEKLILFYDLDPFIWLLKWYHSQCNGDWEHIYGIRINAIDPGWYLTISIGETVLEDIKFNELNIDRSDDNWVNCFIRKNEFIGLGGPFNLVEIIQIFCDWAKKYSE